MVGKEGRRVNMVQKCVHMYMNARVIPAKTTPGIQGGGDKGEQ
jgi:hypothetical protein